MKRTLLLCLGLACLSAFAATTNWPTVRPLYQKFGENHLLLNLDGTVSYPTNFWEANQSAIEEFIDDSIVSNTAYSTAVDAVADTVPGIVATNMAAAPYARAARFNLPPMGWMSWYQSSGPNVTETIVKTTATNMINRGWYDAGFRQINIDAGWAATYRLEDGSITWDTNKFPSTLPVVIEWCHALGIKVGLYTEPTEVTEWGSMGSGGHYDQDAETFASWGVDYVKFDNRQVADSREALTEFSKSIDRTGWPMFLHGYLQTEFDATWVPATVNSFRKGLDISGPSAAAIWGQWFSNFQGVVKYAPYVRPGFYVDFETIPLAVATSYGKTDWLKGMLSVQAILAAPMFTASVNDPAVYLTDGLAQDVDMLSINQDPDVAAASMVSSNAGKVVFVRPLRSVGNTTKAACLFNALTNTAQNITLRWQDLGVKTNTDLQVFDVWTKTSTVASGSYTVSVPPGGAALLKIFPPTAGGSSKLYADGVNYLADYPWESATTTNGAWTDGATRYTESFRCWSSDTFPQPIGKNITYDLQPLTILDGSTTNTYTRGLGMLTGANLEYNLNAEAVSFHMICGMDVREAAPRITVLTILLDGATALTCDVPYGSPTNVTLSTIGKTNMVIRLASKSTTAQYRVTLGDAQIQTTSLPLESLSGEGATTGELMAFNGTSWGGSTNFSFPGLFTATGGFAVGASVGISTNLTVIRPGPVTNTLTFVKGILTDVQ